MKFTKKWKNFWQLQKHTTGGFTLVELIVVIAILAILAGIGVPAYSGYVTKANQQADRTLISEVEDALLLAYYANPTAFPGSAIVCLSTSGASLGTAGDTYTDSAMEAKFGQSWDGEGVLALHYSEWAGNYADTGFDGNEEKLVEKVDVLTTALSDTIFVAGGDNFKKFMSTNGINAENAGGAAVLYVAQTTAGLNLAQQEAFVSTISDATTIDGMINDLSVNVFGGGDTGAVAAIAATYALAEAYCAKNDLDLTLNTEGITDVATAGEAVQGFFGQIVYEVGDEALYNYLGNGAASDAQAYLDIMSTVNGAKSLVISNGLGEFSTLTDIFTGYGDGNVYVYLVNNNDGNVVVSSTLPEG